MFSTSLFVLSLLTIILSVLWLTASNYFLAPSHFLFFLRTNLTVKVKTKYDLNRAIKIKILFVKVVRTRTLSYGMSIVELTVNINQWKNVLYNNCIRILNGQFISRFSKCEYHVRVTVPMAEPSGLPSTSPGADGMSYWREVAIRQSNQN